MKPDPYAYAPRGLGREEAARYIGVPVSKFDDMVADGRMPKPVLVDRRFVWDRFKLDAAFTDLPNATADVVSRLVASGARILAAGEKIVR